MLKPRIQFGKRLFDLALVLPALILLSPLMLVVAGVVAVGLGLPVIFRQERPGLGEKSFFALKFRTMTDELDSNGIPRTVAERLNAVGRFLRRTSLDELPQLWNVARGDMSLIGPRPLLVDYLPNYTPEQRRRHEVMPGITGWAQVHGRNCLLFSERLRMDVWYVDNWSLWLDVKILARTLVQVLGCSGSKPQEDIEAMDDVGLGTLKRRAEDQLRQRRMAS